MNINITAKNYIFLLLKHNNSDCKNVEASFSSKNGKLLKAYIPRNISKITILKEKGDGGYALSKMTSFTKINLKQYNNFKLKIESI